MALFFDVDWFDARLAGKGLDRNDLAASAGIDRNALHALFINNREATGAEMAAFAVLLGADLVEINLRCGIANRDNPRGEGADERIASFEARLDEIDTWLAELETRQKSA